MPCLLTRGLRTQPYLSSPLGFVKRAGLSTDTLCKSLQTLDEVFTSQRSNSRLRCVNETKPYNER
jgi:hypothetical protein